MAARKPLVIVDGQISQLLSSDTLDAAVSEVDVTTATNNNAGAIVLGNVVYVDSANGCDLAQANASGTNDVFGLVRDATVAAAATASIQTNGVLVGTTTQWDATAGTTGGLDPNAIYYLSTADAGEMTTTAPTTVGQYVVPVGFALSTTDFQIRPGHTVAL